MQAIIIATKPTAAIAVALTVAVLVCASCAGVAALVAAYVRFVA